MNLRLTILLACLAPVAALSQGTVIFDQQSSDESRVLEGSIGSLGNGAGTQSFTPSLDGIDFARLWIILGNQGQSLAVNLRAGSPLGSILATSSPAVVQRQSYSGPLEFSFQSRVPLVPGTTYYLQPFPIFGLGFVLNQSLYGYTGGTMYFDNGVAGGSDLWFREGIVVPEPGSFALLALGVGTFVWRRGNRIRS